MFTALIVINWQWRRSVVCSLSLPYKMCVLARYCELYTFTWEICSAAFSFKKVFFSQFWTCWAHEIRISISSVTKYKKTTFRTLVFILKSKNLPIQHPNVPLELRECNHWGWSAGSSEQTGFCRTRWNARE